MIEATNFEKLQPVNGLRLITPASTKENHANVSKLQTLDERDLGIEIYRQSPGRRRLKMRVGDMTIKILEAEAARVLPDEWKIIRDSRESYKHMWGGNGEAEKIKTDPYDSITAEGRYRHTIYDTTHYIARVIKAGHEDKIITMRKVSLNPQRVESKYRLVGGRMPVTDLPEDIAFWRIHDHQNDREFPLWSGVKEYLSKHHTYDDMSTQLSFTAISRAGTLPYTISEREEWQRDRTAIAFAAIQALAMNQEASLLIACQLCDEFRDKAFALVSSSGELVKLTFPTAQQTLGHEDDWEAYLDNSNNDVKTLKKKFPGYWVNNSEAASVLVNLMQENQLYPESLYPALKSLFEEMQAKGGVRFIKELQDMELVEIEGASLRLVDPSKLQYLQNQLATALTRPRSFKHMLPLFSSRKLLPDLTGEELADNLVLYAGDGPWPSLIPTEVWQQSSLNLLLQAKEKYEKKQQ